MGGFLQMLYAYKTRREAELAERIADAAIAEENVLVRQLDALTRQVRRQQEQIETLQALVGVLGGVLHDTGVVDADLLDFRIEAALDEVAAHAQTDQAEARMLACLRCGSRVRPEQTVVTADGTVCDKCAG